MKYLIFGCILTIFLSIFVSELFGTSYSEHLDALVGINLPEIYNNCAKLSPTQDEHLCAIQQLEPRHYLTRWPYVAAYAVLIFLSFFRKDVFAYTAAMSVVLALYQFISMGANTVAGWFNLTVVMVYVTYALKDLLPLIRLK